MSSGLRATGLLGAPLALGLSFLVTLGLSGVGLFVVRLLPGSKFTMLALALVEVVLYVGASLSIARVYVGGSNARALALGRPTALQLLLGASLGVVLHLPAGYLDALVERRFPTPRERMLEQLAQLTPQSQLHAALLVLGVALLAPLAEELFFRGALFSGLKQSGSPLVAICISSIAFVLAHQEPRMWAPLLLVALVLAQLRLEAGSIWPGVALHATFNAATLSSVFATRPVEPQVPDLSWGLGIGGGLLTWLGVWLFARVSRRARALETPP